MQAPAIGGVQIPRGNGQVIRLSRGASLSDFADKIGVNPASLVQVLFHLGEMVTATQSVNDETLQLLGAELHYTVQVASPEEEDRELLEAFAIELGEDQGGDGDLEARPPVVTVKGGAAGGVRAQLTVSGLVAADFAGQSLFAEVAAGEGTGIDARREAIVLTADAELDLRANPDQQAQGVAIEAHLDKGRGPVATVLVQRGTLRVGDSIVCGEAFGRVRAMLDENGDQVGEAPPSRPVH